MKKNKKIEEVRKEILSDPNFSGNFKSEEIKTLVFANLVFINKFLDMQAYILEKYSLPDAMINVIDLTGLIIDNEVIDELRKEINKIL